MKRKHISMILCTAVSLTAVLSFPSAAAGSIEEQMAANSAAWIIAYNAGDKATCDALHQANENLANQLAGSSGSASYDEGSGSWNVTTSTGETVTSSSSSSGKNTTATYTTASSGGISSTSSTTYTDSSIGAYLDGGGTTNGLITSYNNAASSTVSTGQFGNYSYTTTAQDEATVVKYVLGLSDAQADQLQNDLEAAKQEYANAKSDYNAALSSGDMAAAAAAKARMDSAHNSAESIRSGYNYTGDAANVADGGFFYDYGSSSGASSGVTPGIDHSGSPSYSPSYSPIRDPGYAGDPSPVATPAPTYYTISAGSGTGGSISPSGSVSVVEGGSKTFHISPNSGWRIQAVYVDGSNIGAASSYTFSNIHSSHSISATFIPDGRVELGSPTLTDALGVVINGTGTKTGYGIFASLPASYRSVTDLRVTMSYNFGDGSRSVSLEETSSGVFQFPVNASSPMGYRCVYIPVGTLDGSYHLTFTISGRNAAGETISDSQSATLLIRGTMYEDDFTGDS